MRAPNVPEAKHFYEFGKFRLDPCERLLLCDGKAIPLAPKAFATLLMLVENSGHLLKKEELMQRLWPGTFVEEVNLAQNISAIRRALEDQNGGKRYIETVPKVGYRFTAETRKVGSEATQPADLADKLADTDASERTARHWLVRRLVAWASAVILVGAGALLVPQVIEFRSKAGFSDIARPIRSIAVLPLANLSADPAHEYFSDGLTDELITDLAKVGSLQVISRTSVLGYKHSLKKAAQIGTELHVDAIVEGTVERVGNRVRVRVQLIRTSTDQHIWAESYDREVKDVFQLESDVASEIARNIGYLTAEQPSGRARRRTVSAEAYENYLKGRYHWNQRTERGLRAGMEYFQRAITMEPNYAAPYAGLADSYIIMANWGSMPGAEAYPKAESAARKALKIDDQLAEAHTSLAYAMLLYDWDWSGAEEEFRRALTINPNYASAHHFYSVYLMAAGRQDEAQYEIKRALKLDPLSLIINSVVGWIDFEGRRYEQAIEVCEKTLEMDPNYIPVLLDLGTIYMTTGDYKKAAERLERARTVAGENGVVLAYTARVRAYAGRKAEARHILLALERSGKRLFVSDWDLALVYVALGETETALTYLERAADHHEGYVVRLRVEPSLDRLRGESRFKRLEQRLRVPPPGGFGSRPPKTEHSRSIPSTPLGTGLR